MNDEPDQEIGESDHSFAHAAHNAADRLAARLGDEKAAGTWKVFDFEIEIEHHSPSHVTVYRVTVQRGGSG